MSHSVGSPVFYWYLRSNFSLLSNNSGRIDMCIILESNHFNRTWSFDRIWHYIHFESLYMFIDINVFNSTTSDFIEFNYAVNSCISRLFKLRFEKILSPNSSRLRRYENQTSIHHYFLSYYLGGAFLISLIYVLIYIVCRMKLNGHVRDIPKIASAPPLPSGFPTAPQLYST